jgi:hypothetical protein
VTCRICAVTGSVTFPSFGTFFALVGYVESHAGSSTVERCILIDFIYTASKNQKHQVKFLPVSIRGITRRCTVIVTFVRETRKKQKVLSSVPERSYPERTFLADKLTQLQFDFSDSAASVGLRVERAGMSGSCCRRSRDHRSAANRTLT